MHKHKNGALQKSNHNTQVHVNAPNDSDDLIAWAFYRLNANCYLTLVSNMKDYTCTSNFTHETVIYDERKLFCGEWS